jgi:hypothetical protein
MPEQSLAMHLFLEPFKVAAAEGAALELKLRLLAGSVPALESRALDRNLTNVEGAVMAHFRASLTEAEKKTLVACRELRNKVLHADFHAAREKMRTVNVPTSQGGVTKVTISEESVGTIAAKIQAVGDGAEGVSVANTSSTAQGTVYGWLWEAGQAGDFQRAVEEFQKAAAIIERLALLPVAPSKP